MFGAESSRLQRRVRKIGMRMPPNSLFDTDAQGRPTLGSYSSVAGQLRR
jgi:hypothetical protein